jgi:hypothetical protein
LQLAILIYALDGVQKKNENSHQINHYYFMSKRRFPQPGSPFHADTFIILLVDRKDRLTAQEENRYIDRELARNPVARELFADVQAAFPGADLKPDLLTPWPVKPSPDPTAESPGRRPGKSRRTVLLTFAVIIIAVGGCTYAMSRFWRDRPQTEKAQQEPQAAPSKEPQQEHLREPFVLKKKPLYEIALMIKKHYDITVIFDREEIALYRFSGGFDTSLPLEALLEDLMENNNIQYYFDDKNNLHFR